MVFLTFYENKNIAVYSKTKYASSNTPIIKYTHTRLSSLYV